MSTARFLENVTWLTPSFIFSCSIVVIGHHVGASSEARIHASVGASLVGRPREPRRPCAFLVILFAQLILDAKTGAEVLLARLNRLNIVVIVASFLAEKSHVGLRHAPHFIAELVARVELHRKGFVFSSWFSKNPSLTFRSLRLEANVYTSLDYKLIINTK